MKPLHELTPHQRNFFISRWIKRDSLPAELNEADYSGYGVERTYVDFFQFDNYIYSYETFKDSYYTYCYHALVSFPSLQISIDSNEPYVAISPNQLIFIDKSSWGFEVSFEFYNETTEQKVNHIKSFFAFHKRSKI